MMSFKDKYTTAELISKEESLNVDKPVEKDKLVLSNDAYVICEHLECLINKLSGRL